MICRDRCFLTICLGLLLVVTFCLLRPKSVDPLVNSRDKADWFWSYKVHSEELCNLIILGDSRLYRGVSPQAMNSVLPDYKIINFGFSSGGLNAQMYREAERRLKDDGSERIIVFAVAPHALTAESAKNEHFLKELNRPKEVVLQRLSYSPLFDFFKPITPERMKKTLFGENQEPDLYYYQDFYADGWIASHTIPNDEDRATEKYIDLFLKYQVDEQLLNELYEQTGAWVEAGIKVYAFRPPVSDDMFVLENDLSGFNQESFIATFESRGGTWIDITSHGYKTYDGSHLHRDSAVELSINLAEKIKQ